MPDLLDRLKTALADRYAIERELGAGGMATVYLAEDLKHHRQVALKVMRPDIAATVGAGRFAREIEVAARLQHPNILPLLDSGEVAGVFFYVMPYVEGESLRDRLARGGELPIPEAVRILMEVADALSEAHSHGVVHRDIKPDNVMLRGRHALVADFGVAKAVTAATGYQPLTSAGVALGTPTYMAPEQATADPHQDHRVDIYALGVLGYELLTGRAPFSATTAQEMLAAHVTLAPDPIERWRPTVSPALAAVVMKCLAKKPADRWQTAEEVLRQLEPLATPSGGTTPAATAPVRAVRTRRRMAVMIGAALVLAVVATVVALLLLARPLSITVSDLTQVTSDPGVEFEPAISPDGNEVAYVGGPGNERHLFTRPAVNFATSAAVRIGDTTSGSEWLPSWTPDGQRVRFMGCRGFFGYRCTYADVGRMGGAVQALSLVAATVYCTFCSSPTWSPDGTRLVFTRRDTIFVSAVADTVPRPVAVDSAWLGSDRWPHSFAWSPDGRLIAYVSGNSAWRTSGNVMPSSVWIVSATGGKPQPVTTEENLNVSPTWLDGRHLLFVSDRDGQRAVYVVEVGPHGRRGDARIVPGIADPHSISYSVAARRLAYAKFILRQNVRAYPLAPSAPVSIRDGRPVTAGNQVIETQDVSRDGRWVVYSAYARGGLRGFKVPSGGGQPVPLWSGSGVEAPAWSPDGREIAFAYLGMGKELQLGVMPAAGGAPTLIMSDSGLSKDPRWSPDGLHIVFQARWAGRVRVWTLSRDSIGGPWHDPVQLPDSLAYCTDWAPDGSGPLCEDGDGNVLVVTARGNRVLRPDVLRVPSDWWPGYISERFSQDGRTLYFWGQKRGGPTRLLGGTAGIWAVALAGGPPRLVVAFDDPAILGTTWLSVGPDALYLTVSEYESDIWVANLRY